MAAKNIVKIVTLTHFLICIIGLAGHVLQVSHKYFQYTTVSNIKMSLPLSSSSPPSMSACFHLIDVLKLDKLKKMFDINLTRSGDQSFSWNASFIKMDQIAAGSILANLTPATEEVFGSIGGCYYRFNYNVHYYADLECRENFTIEKYLHREYVCYKFTPNFFYNHSLRVAEYSLSSDWQGLIYGINFNPVFFNDAETITSYIHENDSLLLYDSLYASQYFYEKGKKSSFENTTLYPNIRTTYNTIKTAFLEPPYDTDCREYPYYGSKTQYKLSLINNQTMKTLNKTIPFIPIHDINNQSPLMMPTDLLYNKSFFKSFEQLMKEGDAIDLQETCTTKSVIPSSIMFGREHVSFAVFWPTNVHVFIDTSPKSAMLDFIIYLSSCLGLWFGLSVYSLIDILKIFSSKIFKFSHTENGHQVQNTNLSSVTPTSDDLDRINETLRQQSWLISNIILRYDIIDRRLGQQEHLAQV